MNVSSFYCDAIITSTLGVAVGSFLLSNSNLDKALLL